MFYACHLRVAGRYIRKYLNIKKFTQLLNSYHDYSSFRPISRLVEHHTMDIYIS